MKVAPPGGQICNRWNEIQICQKDNLSYKLNTLGPLRIKPDEANKKRCIP